MKTILGLCAGALLLASAQAALAEVVDIEFSGLYQPLDLAPPTPFTANFVFNYPSGALTIRSGFTSGYFDNSNPSQIVSESLVIEPSSGYGITYPGADENLATLYESTGVGLDQSADGSTFNQFSFTLANQSGYLILSINVVPSSMHYIDTPENVTGSYADPIGYGEDQDYEGFIEYYVTGFSVSIVPEPACWAMLIAGFGLVGAAIRRRARPAPGALRHGALQRL